MKRTLKQKLAAGAAIVAVLAGVTTAAMSATGQGQPHAKASASRSLADRHGGRDLVTAAAYLGIDVAQLRGELGSGRTLAEVANATKGKSANGLIAAVVAANRARLALVAATLPRRVTAEVNGAAGRDLGGRATRRRGRSAANRELLSGHRYLGVAAASYLGVTAAQLERDLQGGRTLAQIAVATNGRSPAGLIAALVAAKRQQLAAAVAAGVLTQKRADTLVARLPRRMSALSIAPAR